MRGAVDSIAYNGNGTLTLTTSPCGSCGKRGELSVSDDAFFAWADDGVLIQDAMPSVPKELREQLKSGICPDCWKEYFGTPPDGDAA